MKTTHNLLFDAYTKSQEANREEQRCAAMVRHWQEKHAEALGVARSLDNCLRHLCEETGTHINQINKRIGLE